MFDLVKTVSSENIPIGYKVITTTKTGKKIVIREDKVFWVS